MNETISALIAFVGILILFSIIVQSAQEAVKNILKLRVGVWERFFINLYSKETEFQIGEISFKTRFKMYIKRIWSGNFNGEFEKGFARLKEKLITADNTFKALKKSLRIIVDLDPNAADTPRLILYQLQPVFEAIGRAKGLALPKFMYIYVEVFKKQDINRLYDEIKEFEIQHAKAEHLLQFSKAVVLDFQTACKNLLRTIESVEDQSMKTFEDSISEYRIQAEQNMDSWIGQINEEYRRNMLKWTVAIGFIFVISVNADSLAIYKYLRSDTKVQDKIAEKVKDIKVVKQTADPKDLNRIHGLLKENKLQDVKNLSESFLAKLESDYRMVGAIDEADKINQLKDSVEKIVISNDDEKRNKIRKELDEKYAKIANFNIRLPGVAIEKHMAGLTELELPLGWASDMQRLKALSEKEKAINATKDAKKDEAKDAAKEISKEYWRLILKKIGGLLLTAVLVTFGAPFWNDILKALTGIKEIAQRK